LEDSKKIELYIHIPFCAKKCRYCDFLSFAADEEVQADYIEQLINEIRAQGSQYADYTVTSIFIGGGTPSILKGVRIISIMSAIYEAWKVDAKAEISIECNPGTLDREKLEAYKAADVNRISLGLQSTENKELASLGRIHTYEQFLESYELVRQVGFDNVNIDLMSALPGQTVESWKSTLKKIAMLRPEHISAYSLIIEEGTPFYDLNQTEAFRKSLPDEDAEREMYYETEKILLKNGFERYEISNYAKPGRECIHNIGYWTGVPYIGMGLGASSYIMNRRFHVERDLKQYLAIDMKKDITPLYQDIEHLSFKALMSEFMILGLRMIKGVSGAEFTERFGRNMFDVFSEEIRKNISLKLLEQDGSQLKLTSKGLDVANRVMADFV